MGEKNHQENQATKLEQLFLEVSNPNQEGEQRRQDNADELIEVDVLALPPRREVHQSSKWRLHFSLSAPHWRFVSITVILLGLVTFFYVYYGDELIEYFTQ